MKDLDWICARNKRKLRTFLWRQNTRARAAPNTYKIQQRGYSLLDNNLNCIFESTRNILSILCRASSLSPGLN